MKILVSGSTGLIGSALVPFLTQRGHSVLRLVRTRPEPGTPAIQWDATTGALDEAQLEGLDAVVHLAGENVAGRWTAAKKQRMYDSRVRTTQFLAASLTRLEQPPQVLLTASGTGYYGDCGDKAVDEDSPMGSGFLAGMARDWEAAASPAREAGIRVVHARLGLVLSPQGGALQKMLLPFRLGLGGRLGSGRQYWSWIGINDAVGAIHHALTMPELSGPVNVVAPHSVRNGEFTRMLGRALHRPTPFPVPAFALRLAFGEMADEALLSSTRVQPARLHDSGYAFSRPKLEDALHDLLKR